MCASDLGLAGFPEKICVRSAKTMVIKLFELVNLAKDDDNDVLFAEYETLGMDITLHIHND